MNGVEWALFASEDEAIRATDEMIAKNRTQYHGINPENDKPSIVAPTVTSKFFYIHSEGVNSIIC